MITQFAGAVVRGLLMVMLVAFPALLLTGAGVDAVQIVMLLAIFAGALTVVEYASAYPGLVEFRYAPPFNRLRFVSLAATVFAVTMMCKAQIAPSTMSLFVEAIGGVLGRLLDFPYSPVRLVTLTLPATVDYAHLVLLRNAAATGYLISLVTVVAFLVSVRLHGWPLGRGPFNVWINLPTFDPTAGGDVVRRLERDARVNIALGILLPFLIPAAVKLSYLVLTPMTLEAPQAMIWAVAAWSFLPTSLLMRGIAMGRIAALIREYRRHHRAVAERTFQPA